MEYPQYMQIICKIKIIIVKSLLILLIYKSNWVEFLIFVENCLFENTLVFTNKVGKEKIISFL